jgi:hypothetical protein
MKRSTPDSFKNDVLHTPLLAQIMMFCPLDVGGAKRLHRILCVIPLFQSQLQAFEQRAAPGKRNGLAIYVPVKGDGLAGCIQDNTTVMAGSEVFLSICTQFRDKLIVNII